MTIQFFCAACGQPIEVDDDLANSSVTCPYCRKIVRAPAASALGPACRPPSAPGADVQAMPPAVPAAVSAGALPLVPQVPVRPRTNKFGWIALVCSLLFLLSSMGFLASFKTFLGGADPESLKDEQKMKELTDEMVKKNPSLGSRLVVTLAGACITPLAVIVFTILAFLKDTPPRIPVIVALVLFAGSILLICANPFSLPSGGVG